MKFKNREDAGKKLAEKLKKYKGEKNVIVLGLPRGGVVTAYEIAKKLHLKMDVIVTRKIGAPMQPELAVGALKQNGVAQFNFELMKSLDLSEKDLDDTVEQEKLELQRRLKKYRGDKKALDLKGKIAILVDDGIATGATMNAAITSVRELGAKKIVVAVPVSPINILEKIKKEVDETVCLFSSELFFGVGGFYESFEQTQDEMVVSLITRARSV